MNNHCSAVDCTDVGDRKEHLRGSRGILGDRYKGHGGRESRRATAWKNETGIHNGRVENGSGNREDGGEQQIYTRQTGVTTHQIAADVGLCPTDRLTGDWFIKEHCETPGINSK